MGGWVTPGALGARLRAELGSVKQETLELGGVEPGSGFGIAAFWRNQVCFPIPSVRFGWLVSCHTLLCHFSSHFRYPPLGEKAEGVSSEARRWWLGRLLGRGQDGEDMQTRVGPR